MVKDREAGYYLIDDNDGEKMKDEAGKEDKR